MTPAEGAVLDEEAIRVALAVLSGLSRPTARPPIPMPGRPGDRLRTGRRARSSAAASGWGPVRASPLSTWWRNYDLEHPDLPLEASELPPFGPGAAEYVALAADTTVLCAGDARFTADHDQLAAADPEQMTTMCARCPIRRLCARYAEAGRVETGFWAGTHREPAPPSGDATRKNSTERN